MKLKIDEIRFDSAHYIPGYAGKCAGIHGHTYTVKDLVIDITDVQWDTDTGISIDFAVIKAYFDREWDHKFIVPPEWEENMVFMNMPYNLKTLPYTTAECMAHEIRSDLTCIAEGGEVHFSLYEGYGKCVMI